MGGRKAARAGPARRRAAREAAIQVLYCSEVGGTSPDEALAAYRASGVGSLDAAAEELARTLVLGTAAHLARIDPLVEAQAEHWRLERMAIVDRWILRLGAYELLETDTPRAVVINEAVELARTFSTEDAVRFVNGVLDGLARALARR